MRISADDRDRLRTVRKLLRRSVPLGIPVFLELPNDSGAWSELCFACWLSDAGCFRVVCDATCAN